MTSPKQRRLAAFEANGFDRSGRHADWDRPTEFTRYDPATGEVLETGIMPVAGVAHLIEQNGWSYLYQSARIGEHYVDMSGECPRRRVRSSCPAVLDGVTLLSLPVPCTLTVVDGGGGRTVINCTDASLHLDFDYPGRYQVTVSSIPHTDATFIIEV